jgi:hypothetical protein
VKERYDRSQKQAKVEEVAKVVFQEYNLRDQGRHL